MRAHSSTRYAALALLVGGLACASNKARTDDTDQAAAARDTTRDSVGGEVQNPPGYRGMERDTTVAPPAQQTPSDTFLQQQGQGQAQDTSGYSGMERVDTTGQADTTGAAAGARDTSGALGADTTGAYRGADTTGAGHPGMDTTGMGAPRLRDTTGYNPSQQPSQDTTPVR